MYPPPYPISRSVLAYLYFSPAGLLFRKPKLMVSRPTRPKYINSMIMSLEGAGRSGVAPAVSPTVPSAETVSYRLSAKPTGAVALMKTAPAKASEIMRMKIVIAFSTWSLEIVRWNTLTE